MALESITTSIITVVDSSTRLTFVYEGGAYIEVFDEGWNSVSDVINVWDYAADKSKIAFSVAAVETKVRQYLRELND